MKIRSPFGRTILAALACLVAGWAGCSSKPRERHVEYLSSPLTIDRKYQAMKGPESAENLVIGNKDDGDVLWLRGAQTEMVGADGKSPVSQEFNCHTELDFENYDGRGHKKIFGYEKEILQWIFALSEGQTSIRFPEGYGLPVMSGQTLTLSSQVLNNTVENPNFQVRYKYGIDYIPHKDLKNPLKPLFVRMAPAVVPYEAAPDSKPDESCSMHKRASDRSNYVDPSGIKYTPHWVIQPGRETFRSKASHFMDLPFDTTVHYIAVHLHPYAESVELRDVTADKTVFKSMAVNFKEHQGLESVSSFSSAEGVPLFKDHEYELITVYNNTTSVPQDAMAALWLYLFDKEFKMPDPRTARNE